MFEAVAVTGLPRNVANTHQWIREVHTNLFGLASGAPVEPAAKTLVSVAVAARAAVFA